MPPEELEIRGFSKMFAPVRSIMYPRVVPLPCPKKPPMTMREEKLQEALGALQSEASYYGTFSDQYIDWLEEKVSTASRLLSEALQLFEESVEDDIVMDGIVYCGRCGSAVDSSEKPKGFVSIPHPSFPSDEEIDAAAQTAWLTRFPLYRISDPGIDHTALERFVDNWKACAQWLRERMTGKKDNG
jgi:hypothetical protein